MVGSDPDEAVTEQKVVLRPLFGLMKGVAAADVEMFVVQEIGKHRRLRAEATKLEQEIGDLRRPHGLDAAERAYVSAMIALHAQHSVVSTLLDILGYIPDVAGKTAH